MSSLVVIGAGVVGQSTGRGFAKKGHQITYIEIDASKREQLTKQGLNVVAPGQLDWNQVDVVMLSVSTPTRNGRIILEQLESATAEVGAGLATTSKFVVVVVRSTVPPTTTEERVLPILERTSRKSAGVDFGVAANPEFLRQRFAQQDFDRPWITVIGALDRFTSEVLHTLYTPFGGLIISCTPAEAEMIKYVNNIYNAVKISYFNEVHEICTHLGIDSNIVSAVVARSAEGMWNPLYGTRGGTPYGGACLPKDTIGFLGFCQERGWDHHILAAAIQVNQSLEQVIPPAASPDQIDQIVTSMRLPQAL